MEYYLNDNETFYKLPCKIGDSVYLIKKLDNEYTVCERKVSGIFIEKKSLTLYFDSTVGDGWEFLDKLRFGDNLFHTREEAERKAKALNENKRFDVEE